MVNEGLQIDDKLKLVLAKVEVNKKTEKYNFSVLNWPTQEYKYWPSVISELPYLICMCTTV